MRSKILWLKTAKVIAFTTSVVLLSSCGGSSSTSTSATATSTGSAAFSVALKGPTHAIAGIPATYQVRGKSSLAVSQTVDFKDTSPVATQAKNIKVWSGPGRFEVLTQAQSADGTSASHTKPVFVAADPIASNSNHSCALKDDGTVACWGNMAVSLLTDPSNPAGIVLASATPQTIIGLSDVGVIATGNAHNCVVKLGGTVWCWGDGRHGELGNGVIGYSYNAVKATPAQVPGIADAFYVAAGDGSSCAIHGSSFDVSCWGGIRVENGVNAGKSSPTLISGVSGAKGLATGSSASCAIVGATKAVWCWKNFDATPVPISLGISGVTQISAHGGFFVGINADKTLSRWGFDINTGVLLNAPTPVSGLNNVLSAKVNQSPYSLNVCALVEGGSVLCAGRVEVQGGGVAYSVQPIAGVSSATAISVDDEYACALDKYGDVKCWGKGSLTAAISPFGRLVTQAGYQAPQSTTAGAVFWHDIPVVISPLATTGSGACAIKETGGVQCWNYAGTVDGSGNRISNVYDLPNSSDVVSIKSNSSSPMCGVFDDGSVACGDFANKVAGITDAVDIGAYQDGACAVLASGRVKCWGLNSWGIHGYPVEGYSSDGYTIATTAYVAREVPGVTDAISISTEPYSVCVLKRDKTLMCWGANAYQQSGNSTIVNPQGGSYFAHNHVPTTVAGLAGVIDVSKNVGGTCAIVSSLPSNKLFCWGYNYPISSAIPDLWPDMAGLLKVTGDGDGTDQSQCGILANGNVRCLGTNNAGNLGVALGINQYQLLNGGYYPAYSSTGTTVTNLSNVTAVVTGSGRGANCALNATGQLFCWGGRALLPTDQQTAIASNGDVVPLFQTANFTPVASPSGAIYWRP